MITCKKLKFSLPDKVTYLNCGYMSPLLKTAEKAAIRTLRKRRDPSTITPSDFFTESDELRKEFAQLINAPEPKRIVIIPSASYGLSTVAHNVQAGHGDNIIVAGEQFPSNYYPWQRLAIEKGITLKAVDAPSDVHNRGQLWNERLLDAIDQNTKVVAIGNIHWADGTLFQLKALRKRTSEVGALLIIDGTQSIGALPFDIAEIQPDAVVCAGYKWLLGPYSIGLAYYGPYFDNGRPIEESWMNRLNSDDFTKLLIYEEQYQPGALRYEVGEHSNFIHVSMLRKSIEQINRWGVENIQTYCTQITRDAVIKLREHGYWIEDEAHRSAHLFGVRPQGNDVQPLKEILLKNRVFVSFRGNALRISPNVYNTDRDLNKLARLLTK